MIGLQIQQLKTFMYHLLCQETFDSFLLCEATITTGTTFSVDGRLHREFYEGEDAPEEEFAKWRELRPLCFQLIKGKRTPLSFKFVFQLSRENLEKLLQQAGQMEALPSVGGLFLNIIFDGSALKCITGTSMRVFTMDKTLEREWDEMVKKLFLKHEIAFE